MDIGFTARRITELFHVGILLKGANALLEIVDGLSTA
jgi:uncharacterized membrane protein